MEKNHWKVTNEVQLGQSICYEIHLILTKEEKKTSEILLILSLDLNVKEFLLMFNCLQYINHFYA